MTGITAILRYFPLGTVAGPANPIKFEDVEAIAEKHNISISLEEVTGKNALIEEGMLREDTMNSALEEISQSVITVSAQDEASFRAAIKDLVHEYRAPRTVYGTWGSSEKGKQIVAEIFDEYDGWS